MEAVFWMNVMLTSRQRPNDEWTLSGTACPSNWWIFWHSGVFAGWVLRLVGVSLGQLKIQGSEARCVALAVLSVHPPSEYFLADIILWTNWKYSLKDICLRPIVLLKNKMLSLEWWIGGRLLLVL